MGKRTQISKVNRQLRVLREEGEYTLPTMTTTGKQLLTRGSVFLTGERKGSIRSYREYRAYVREVIVPHDKSYKPMEKAEYEQMVEEFTQTYSAYTTDLALTKPTNLFTSRGQREYYYRRAEYVLGEAGYSNNFVRGLSKQEIDRMLKIANEILDLDTQYESKQGERKYYEILSRVVDDFRKGNIEEGEHFITRVDKDGKFQYDLTDSGKKFYGY